MQSPLALALTALASSPGDAIPGDRTLVHKPEMET